MKSLVKTNRSKLYLAIPIVVLCAALLLVIARFDKPVKPIEPTIVHAQLGQHDLYIPSIYLKFSYTSVGDESALIQAYYPGGTPVFDDSRKLYDENLWFKQVRILFNDRAQIPDFDLEKSLAAKIRLFKATKIVGDQYGLTYQTQPDDIENNWNELWVQRNNETLVSFIDCRKQYTPRTTPQCTHHFYDANFTYAVSYDKRLLPDWKIIQTNAQSLIHSFSSSKSANAYLHNQFSTYQNIKSGD